MATVVDALVVTLGLDLAGMKKGAGEAEGVLEQLAGTARKALTVIGGLALLKQTVSNYLDSADAVGRFSQALGLDVEMVQMWSNAADRAGGSAESMQGTIKHLSEELGRLKLYGLSPTLGMWQWFGVQLRDGSGQIKDVDGLLMTLAQRFDGMDKMRSLAIGKKLGLDEGTIVLLQQGKKAVEDLLARQRELGVYTKQDVELARKTKAAWADLKQAWDLTAAVAMRVLTPALKWVADKLTDIVLWVRGHKDFVYAFFTGVAAIVGAILIPMLYSMATAWLAAFAPILPIVGLVTALGTAIALLYDDYTAWKEGGESLFGDSWKTVEEFVGLTVDAFKSLGAIMMAFWGLIKPLVGKELSAVLDILRGVFQVIAGLLQWLADLFTGNWQGMSEAGMRILEGFGNMAKGIFLGLVQPILFVANLIQSAWTAALDWVSNKLGVLGEKWEAFKAMFGFGGDKTPAATPQASAAAAQSPLAIAGATTNTKSVQASTKIDQITVNTQATDAKGIAGGIGQAVESQNLALAFDGGVY